MFLRCCCCDVPEIDRSPTVLDAMVPDAAVLDAAVPLHQARLTELSFVFSAFRTQDVHALPQIQRSNVRRRYAQSDIVEATRILARMPRHKWCSPSKDELASVGDLTCGICLCEYDEGCKILTLPCMHSAHTNCLERWILERPSCHICRTSVVPEREGTFCV